MNRAKMIDQFMHDLRANPNATPPPGLDAVTTEFVRQLVIAETIPPASSDVRARVWKRALAGSQPDESPNTIRHPKFSANGRGAMTHDLNHEEENQMTTLSIPRRQAPVRSLRHAALLAAVLSVILFSSALFFVGNQNSPSDPAAVYYSLEAVNRTVFELYINEAWNTGNTDVLNDILTPDHICHEPGMPDIEGIDGMAAMIAHHHTAFSDIHFTIESITATDTEVWARVTITGTHDGPFALSENMIIEATGNALTVEAMFNARFTNGMIAEQWVQSDAFGMLFQMGTIPLPQQAVIEAQNLDVARRAVEAFGNPEIPFDADNYYHGDALWGEGTVGPLDHSTAQRNDWVNNELWIAFPGLQITIDQITADGNLVIVEATAEGRFEENLLWVNNRYVPATGAITSWSWVYVYRFEDGKIAAEQWYWDWRSVYES